MKKLFVVLVLLIIFAVPAEAATVGLWLFDEDSGSIAYDSSGYGNDGTIYGATRTADTPFAYEGNRAMSFDGFSNYINSGSDSSLYLRDTFTIEAWVKPQTTGLRYIADKSHIYCLTLNDGTQYPLAGIKKGDEAYGAYYNLVSDTMIPLNTWSHVASIYDGSVLKIYVNGELAGENDLKSGSMYDASLHPSSDFIIGNHSLIDYTLGGYYFDGLIDEVRISNIALAPGKLGYHGSAVPEPSTILLFGSALAGLGFWKRKRT